MLPMAAVLAAALALSQEKPDKDRTYEFLPPPPMASGDVYHIVAQEKDVTWATFYEGSTLLRGLKIGKTLSFDASQEVLEAERGRPLSARWTFTRATEAKNDNEKPLRCQGRTVLATQKDDLLLLKYEPGTYLPLEDQKAIRQPILGLHDRGAVEETRDPVFEDVFSPGRTLKVGEAWEIPIRQAVRVVGGADRAWSIDEKTSKAKASLASVERRGGALLGRIRTEFDFKVNALETLRFEKPIQIRVQMDYVGAIDGSRPDSQLTVKLDFKGVSDARDPSGRRLKVEFDSSFERSITRKQVTKE
jgi:hypothetical protein